MTDLTLTLLDTSAIQDYIFRSNRLAENIGASELVHRATELWAFQVLDEVTEGRHNIKIIDPYTAQWAFRGGCAIEQDQNLDAEVVYAGGGNTLILFRNERQAVETTRRLTWRVLGEAPGLNLVAKHRRFSWDQRLDVGRTDLVEDLGRHKFARLPSSPFLGLGVTAPCQSTGGVAVISDEKWKQEDESARLISREIARKLEAGTLARQRLDRQVGSRIDRFRFPYEIDNLGRMAGEESYVAVVHADGNRMGGHIDRVAGDIDWTNVQKANRQYVGRLRAFSEKVQNAGIAALGGLAGAADWNKERGGCSIAGEIPLIADFLPFRPLVYGGDDVTFVCNGQLGLTLAAAYLEQFEDETRRRKLGDKDQGLRACAGVAIVKMHYPYARAYALSEALCKGAKSLVRDREPDVSALDWHFATAGLSGTLGEIRQREYTTPAGDPLCMRPLLLRGGPHTQDGRFWMDGFERLIRELQSGKDWGERRNKVKAIGMRLREGPDVVAAYRGGLGLPMLPALLPSREDHQKTGWHGRQCIHFDAIELLDHYLPLTFHAEEAP